MKMFDFITKRLKFKRIVNRQFNQHVIFIALEAGEYFMSDRWNQIPEVTNNFKVEFKVLNDSKILQIIILIDEQRYILNINTETESAAYFTNFLESICCFKTWDSLVYVSSTDKPKDFLCINLVEPLIFRVMALIDNPDNPQYIDICVDAKLFCSELISPLFECKPFSKYIAEAKLLEKYSPNKVLLPIH